MALGDAGLKPIPFFKSNNAAVDHVNRYDPCYMSAVIPQPRPLCGLLYAYYVGRMSSCGNYSLQSSPPPPRLLQDADAHIQPWHGRPSHYKLSAISAFLLRNTPALPTYAYSIVIEIYQIRDYSA